MTYPRLLCGKFLYIPIHQLRTFLLPTLKDFKSARSEIMFCLSMARCQSESIGQTDLLTDLNLFSQSVDQNIILVRV